MPGQMHQNGAQPAARAARCQRFLHRLSAKSLILQKNPPHAERCKICRILKPIQINELAAAVSDYLTLYAQRSVRRKPTAQEAAHAAIIHALIGRCQKSRERRSEPARCIAGHWARILQQNPALCAGAQPRLCAALLAGTGLAYRLAPQPRPKGYCHVRHQCF